MKLKFKSYQANLLACVLFVSSSSAFAKKPHPNNTDRGLQQAYYQLLKNPLSLKNKHLQKRARFAHHTNNKNYRIRAAQVAKQQLRKKYLWGGKSPYKGFDCSGLMQYAYQKANTRLPRTTAEQYKYTQRIRIANLLVGDLIFFKTRRSHQRVNHVGIYMGGGNFIHAPRRGKSVSISKLNKYWRMKVVGAGRV